eukprot:m.62662 g.62662  ORF g.62662 m.62662 type:complete len:56 (+) comp13411_c0_seq1:1855-2022(+)
MRVSAIVFVGFSTVLLERDEKWRLHCSYSARATHYWSPNLAVKMTDGDDGSEDGR